MGYSPISNNIRAICLIFRSKMKMKLKPEDIMFWILIMLIVGVAIWKLVGSPTDTATLIAVILFFASSELLIWRKMFEIEKKTAVSFIKIGNELKEDIHNLDMKIEKLNTFVTRKL